MNDNSSDADQLILQLAHTLYGANRAGWAETRVLAKRMQGSEEFALFIANIDQLPKGQPYFNVSANERFIRFTERGVRFAQQTPPEAGPTTRKASPTEQIARAVKENASKLRRQMLTISSVSTILYTTTDTGNGLSTASRATSPPASARVRLSIKTWADGA